MPEPKSVQTPQPPVAAASASPAAPAPSLVDQYDAEGDSEPAAPASEVARSPSPDPEVRGPDRPRNADGTFAPATVQDRKPSQHLTQTALELGITADEIASTSADALEVAVYHLTKQQRVIQQWSRERENSREQRRDQALDRNLGQQAADVQPATADAQRTTPAQQRPDDDAYDLGVEPGRLDAEFENMLRKNFAAQAREIKQLKQQLAQLHHLESVRANESFAQKMDRLFAGDEDTFGKGEGRTLKEDGPELARRRAVLGVMQSIKAGTIEDKYEKAYEMLYGTRQTPVEDALAQKQDEWRRGNVARPTQRTGAAEPAGVEKAKRSVASKLQEMNGAAESGEAEADDFLG